MLLLVLQVVKYPATGGRPRVGDKPSLHVPGDFGSGTCSCHRKVWRETPPGNFARDFPILLFVCQGPFLTSETPHGAHALRTWAFFQSHFEFPEQVRPGRRARSGRELGLDVAAAHLLAAAAERVVTCVVGERVRVTDDACGGSSDSALEALRVERLPEAVDLLLERLDLVLLHHRASSLTLGRDGLLDLGGLHGDVEVDLIGCAELVAAALVLLGHLIRLADGKCGDVALQLGVLVAKRRIEVVEDLVGRGDGLGGAAGNGSHQIAVLILQVVEIESVLNEVLGRVLGLVAIAAATPAEPVAAPEDGEQGDNPKLLSKRLFILFF